MQLATLEKKKKRNLSLNSNESVSVLANSLPEVVLKDSFDIYQNARKEIIDEKPDKVTLGESHSQEKAQIHRKLPISKTHASQANLNTDSQVSLKSLLQIKNEIQFSFGTIKATQKMRNKVS